MKMFNSKKVNNLLIVSISPYFLNKRNLWFEKNLNKILKAKRTQSFWQENTIFCEPNQDYNFSQFLRKLDELGYEKVFQVTTPGEFAQRGGIIDVFPVNSNLAFRLEFKGNKIENIEKLKIKTENEEKSKKVLKKKLKSQRLFSNLKKLKSGDYLVHLDHGIARFLEIKEKTSTVESENHKYYVLEYAKGDKLYVPVGLERKLSRYIGFVAPKISRLGSSLWQRTKKKAKEEAEKLAKELLQLYAKKEITKRKPYFIDNEIQSQLGASFPYQETPDQIQAIKDIKNDMKKQKPMDRIICGDVGFGKTEVALRSAVIATTNNRQTTMVCPTTILANQHFNNFKERLEKLPIGIEILSRLQTKKEQKKIIRGLKKGKIDIVIGTHRLFSSDIEFNNLQLLIIDDEQKFGVKQKEKLRKIRSSLDVLSLSATPIPRTLYLALSSLKDISLIQTPPENRSPIKTFVSPYKKEIIKRAIRSELKRGGQTYFLHNRVETINHTKERLEKLVPEAKISLIHGRLNENRLLEVMNKFQKEKINVLVATTIIENGLDFPKVNTLIVEDSTRLGLSQAYQLRGRIGRSYIKSFAYFLYPQPQKNLPPLAKKRLKALKQAESLGSGYSIALKDLEIRGAGNVLGKEQSGSVNAVGLNLYCQMLSETIEKLKNTKEN